MKEYILKNNMKLIYKKSTSSLTSISISVDAGAGEEDGKLGVAHATEHMVYKGTKSRSEAEINKNLTSIFGFQNAMTNFPYVIYYGSLLAEDFEKGIELFSDIIINPIFSKEGFNEEMDVIIEELKEWDEEVEQYCEDMLFLNSFSNRRIKYPIIGTQESLKNIKLDDLKDFYNNKYVPENTAIAVVSSLEFSEVKEIVKKYFGGWNIFRAEEKGNKELICNENKGEEIFVNYREGINTCKVEMIFDINNLSNDELKVLRVFNEYFGEGVSSVLFDTLRTKSGIVYDVLTKIAYEKHIKLYKINFSTSSENLEKAIELVNSCIADLKNKNLLIENKNISGYIKSLKLKRLFREEQSIILAKELSTYATMFGDYRIYSNELEELSWITEDVILKVIEKVLTYPKIQIIKNNK